MTRGATGHARDVAHHAGVVPQCLANLAGAVDPTPTDVHGTCRIPITDGEFQPMLDVGRLWC